MKILNEQKCRNLDDQGYTFLSQEEKSKLNFALRFTPTLCIIIVIFGMYLQDWRIFGVLTIFGILGSAFSQGQPFDVLYNTVLRNIFKTPKLPPSPPQKRFACALGAIFLFGATVSFYYHATIFGVLFGVGYIIAAGIMAGTHWCAGSWIYNHLFGTSRKGPRKG